MLVPVKSLLEQAQGGHYAIGAFNVYNLEGVRAVTSAAEQENSPAVLQVHPAALRHGGEPLLASCLAAARATPAPIGVHLDHAASEDAIRGALATGLSSVMADGSHLPYADNLAFSRAMAILAHASGATLEAELGRLAGTEDNSAVAEYEAHFTDPTQAGEFVSAAGIDALAVCIGNVHGRYPGRPRLDFDRLAALRRTVPVPLVLHGASGLPSTMVHRAIELGVCKFNVNTELREAYVRALRESLAASPSTELLELLQAAVNHMQDVVAVKLRLFGSAGRA
jgi:tagatose 1,6-diphosphate aldolase GatY/KbaY